MTFNFKNIPPFNSCSINATFKTFESHFKMRKGVFGLNACSFEFVFSQFVENDNLETLKPCL